MGSKWALQRAKANIVRSYLLVGVTEQLGEFISVLEVTLPRVFKGALHIYNEGMSLGTVHLTWMGGGGGGGAGLGFFGGKCLSANLYYWLLNGWSLQTVRW